MSGAFLALIAVIAMFSCGVIIFLIALPLGILVGTVAAIAMMLFFPLNFVYEMLCKNDFFNGNT
jgi:hypothetical protein